MKESSVIATMGTPRIPIPRSTGLFVFEKGYFLPFPGKFYWEALYGGNMNYDHTSKILSVVTNGTDPHDWFGARIGLETTDMTQYAWKMKVKFTDWENLTTGLLILATDEGVFENTFAFNFRKYFMKPESDEWIDLRIDKTDFDVSSGDTDWSHVTDLILRVAGSYTKPAAISIKDIELVPVAAESVITLAFDDGLRDVSDIAFPIMEELGYKGTNYIIPSWLSREGYQSFEDLHILHDAGWDISAHSGQDLRSLSQEDLESEVESACRFFELYPFTGHEHFAYPNGSYNQRVITEVAKCFATGRNIDGLSQPQNSIAPYNINAKTVSLKTDVEDIKQWIDDAREEKSWLILVWHSLPETAESDTEYPREGFTEVLEYIASSGIPVKTMSEVLR